jgi:predicted nucleic acid-binding protein
MAKSSQPTRGGVPLLSSRGELVTVDHVREFMDFFALQSNHEFWPDDLSLRDKTTFLRDRLHSSRAITDVYLLALAVKHQGSLATFDEAIVVSAVPRAATANLYAI